jgi:hypothetical protein
MGAVEAVMEPLSARVVAAVLEVTRVKAEMHMMEILPVVVEVAATAAGAGVSAFTGRAQLGSTI